MLILIIKVVWFPKRFWPKGRGMILALFLRRQSNVVETRYNVVTIRRFSFK